MEKGEKFEEGNKKDREGERKVFWKVESKDDVKGGQQERIKVVENVMNRLKEREEDKEKRSCEARVVQENEGRADGCDKSD